MKRTDMAYEEIVWHTEDHNFVIGLDRLGEGPTVLLLPALSSISTRHEMRPLQERLARSFTTIAVDWPGFGVLPKPAVDWRPEVYLAFLEYLFTQVVPQPYGVIAAGHASGYLLKHITLHKGISEKLILLSPTWRGPLPTMMNGYRPVFLKIAKAFDIPLLGAMLYGLNVNRVVVGMMARGHVYSDPDWLTGERLQGKLAVTNAPGARHSSARFVTGCLDPFQSRDEQMDELRKIAVPILNLFSETAPKKSRLEMEALAKSDNVKTVKLPKGKLSFYEEFPDDTVTEINAFLQQGKPVESCVAQDTNS